MDRLLLPIKLVGKGQTKLLNFILRFNPNHVEEQEDIDYNWSQWKEALKLSHFLVSLFTIAVVIGTYLVLYEVPGLKYSLASVTASLINAVIQMSIHSEVDFSSPILAVILILMVVFRDHLSSLWGSLDSILENLPKYAMREEVVFRKNSEVFSFRERVLSCLSFGFAHFTMLIVPLAALPALSLAGGIFMVAYLRVYRVTESHHEALVEAATIHATYNLILITWAFLSLFRSTVIEFFFH